MHNFKQCLNWLQLILMLLLVNFSCELVQQKCSDIASLGPGEWFYAMLKMIPTLPNFGFGQLIMWIGAKNDYIIKSMWSTIYNMIIRCSTRLAPNEAISGYFCPNSHDKLAKSKFGSISINLNIVQNNMFIIKGVVSGHYSHISQFTYKCIVWTVIIWRWRG